MNNQPFLLSKADAKKACLAFGFGSFAIALVEIISPRTTAPTGRWSWVTAPIYEAFGTYGLSALWAIVGVVLIGMAFKPSSE